MIQSAVMYLRYGLQLWMLAGVLLWALWREMNCPECNQPFSIVEDTIHGERVQRPRLCTVCKASWWTVELPANELRSLELAAEKSRQQIAQMWRGT